MSTRLEREQTAGYNAGFYEIDSVSVERTRNVTLL